MYVPTTGTQCHPHTPVVDDGLRLEAGALEELYQQLLDTGLQLRDELHPGQSEAGGWVRQVGEAGEGGG